MWLISPLLTSLIFFCGNPSPLHGNQLYSVLPPSPFSSNIVLLFFLGLDFSSDLPSLSLSHPPFFSLLANPPLPASVPAVKDVSVQMSQIMFACPAVKTGGGVPFIPPHILRKEMGGRRALTLVFGHKQLSLIIVFLFSFPVVMEVWRDEHAIIRSSRPESAGLRSLGSVLGLWSFHLNVSQELIQTWSDGRINPWDPAFNGLS